MVVLLCILFVLCVILLLPIRIKVSFGDGKWSVTVYYTFLRVFRKASAPPPPPPAAPQTPESPDADRPGTGPAAEAADAAIAVEEPPEPKKRKKPKQKKPEKPKPQPEQSEPETAEAEPDETPAAEEPAPPKKKRGIKAFLARLKPHSVSDVMGLLDDGLGSLSPSLRFLLRHFHFRHVKLYLAVASGDPANTATLYGKICAAAFNLLAQLQCLLDIETDEFRILADFYHESMTLRAALELRVSPAALILTVLILGCKFLWRTLRRFRREDREAALREKETAPLVQGTN